MSKIGKLGLTWLVLAASFQFGCTALRQEVKDTKPEARAKISQTTADEFNQGDIYQSDVIRPEYGFKVVRKLYGSIDEKAYPKIEEGFAYILGYSQVCASERLTERLARENAQKKAIRMGAVKQIGPDTYIFSRMQSIENEVWEVEKDGRRGYVSHTVFKIPITGNQDNQKSK